jgi:hypothetical protein
MQRPMQRMPDPGAVDAGPMGESPFLAQLRGQQGVNRGEQNAGTMAHQGTAGMQQALIAQQSAAGTEGHRMKGAFLEAAHNQIDSPGKLDPRLAGALAASKRGAAARLGLSSTNEAEVLAGA